MTVLEADHLALSDAARRLGMSEATVRRWADAGILPSTRTAYGRLIDARAVAQLARAREAQRAGRGE